MSEPELQLTTVNDIPVAVCLPPDNLSQGKLAIWLPYLGGDRQTVKRELVSLSLAGYTAVSLDPWLHGARKDGGKTGIRSRVFKHFRAIMWPILGYTTLDALCVADWAMQTYSLHDKYVAGGVSMGSDIALVLAGIDQRVERVAGVASSPDWLRPGMTDAMNSAKLIDQGQSTALGQWFYDQLNPATHISAYQNRVLSIYAELGEADTHISPRRMIDFEAAASKSSQRVACSFNINKGAKHLSLIQSRTILTRCLDFLVAQG